ncbi:MAG TPA: 2-oxoglutarate dehydrogenase complex dihydrolipoyllysine-residue succinyltransferase [Methylococcaceae bacterium]|jgi:2-oxoglutarate dehydrogenase E2 component (dihydrolipoamide succinyltransferase)|nr:2-oxoglutarate dehydrogenase complex dihydrolipoyllysine-residue succinyltransferase [Methylococcaceae bacterium]
MRVEVTVPHLPESVQDATLMDWHKKPGDPVQQGETLVDLETDKVVLEVPAPETGILQQILRNKGEIATSSEPLAVIETEAPARVIAEQAAPPAKTAETPQMSSQPLSPAVRRLLTEHGLEPAQIRGTGKDGRLTKQDVLDYLEARTAELGPTPEPVSVIAPEKTVSKEARGDRRVAMTRLRARIAERMIQSQHSTATLTTFNEVNLQKIFELRNLYKARFEQEHNIKLGFMSFFVKASVEALKRFPIVNASIDGDDIVFHDYYDIGIAVSTDRGLVVPILRDADTLDFGAIEKAVIEFARKARDGKLSYEELTGGTFSITNGGIYGSLLSTPILNPPQSAILGMHAIKERPMVENGQIVIRPMIYLALSYDHRLIDGRDAVLFLYTIKELLEDPVRMVLNV